jgi:four helix bundle protein
MSLPYHKLVVWQRADDLFIDIHRLTLQHFPREEKFELGSQLRRSSYSLPANLVEGSAREHPRDRLRFFNIASSSLSETGYGLHAARRLGYISEETYLEYEARVRAVAAPLNGLIRANRAAHIANAAVKLGAFAVLAFQFFAVGVEGQPEKQGRRRRTAAPPTSAEGARPTSSQRLQVLRRERSRRVRLDHHRRHVSGCGFSSVRFRGVRLAL